MAAISLQSISTATADEFIKLDEERKRPVWPFAIESFDDRELMGANARTQVASTID